MEALGTESNPSTHDQWHDLAGRVAAIIRDSGIDNFRQAVCYWAFKHAEDENKRLHREEERLEALKKDGVLYRDDSIPDMPEGDWFFYLKTVRGSVKLPPELELPPEPPQRGELQTCLRDQVPNDSRSDTDKNEVKTFQEACAKINRRESALFKYVKQQGFPAHEEDGSLYEFEVCAWLPSELHFAKDPPLSSLLPIPRRELMDAEKLTILAAVFDAHWRGAEKVAPWGVSEDGEGPDPWPSDARRDDRSAALSYFMLYRQAENADSGDLPIIRSWMDESRLPFQHFDLSGGDPCAFSQDIPEPSPPLPPLPPFPPTSLTDQTFVFAMYGDGYFIRGFGAEGHFKFQVGLLRLERLLREAGRPVLMTSLVSNGESPRAVAALDQVIETQEDDESGFLHCDTQEEVLNEDALRHFQKELARLGDEIDNAKYNGDMATIQRLTDEKEQVIIQLNKDTRFDGKKSRRVATLTDKLRSRIANSLADAYRLLRKANPPLGKLADHLKLAVKAQGPIYIYSPQPVPPWSFKKPSS